MASDRTTYSRTNGGLSHFLGGSPGAVLVRLVLLSVVVGVLLAVLGLDASGMIAMVRHYAMELLANSAHAIRAIVHYFVLGAVIVVPIWLLVRLSRLAARR